MRVEDHEANLRAASARLTEAAERTRAAMHELEQAQACQDAAFAEFLRMRKEFFGEE